MFLLNFPKSFDWIRQMTKKINDSFKKKSWFQISKSRHTSFIFSANWILNHQWILLNNEVKIKWKFSVIIRLNLDWKVAKKQFVLYCFSQVLSDKVTNQLFLLLVSSYLAVKKKKKILFMFFFINIIHSKWLIMCSSFLPSAKSISERVSLLTRNIRFGCIETWNASEGLLKPFWSLNEMSIIFTVTQVKSCEKHEAQLALSHNLIQIHKSHLQLTRWASGEVAPIWEAEMLAMHLSFL